MRIPAAAPLLVMVPLYNYTVIGYSQKSNQWPLLLLLASPAASVYVLVMATRTGPRSTD